MKKWICIALVCLLLPATLSLAASDTNEYRLEAGKLSVSIPNDMIVLTAGMSEEEISAAGFDPAQILPLFVDQLLLDAFVMDDLGLMEITVVMPYLNASDEELKDIREARDFNRFDEEELLSEFGKQFSPENRENLIANADQPDVASSLQFSGDDISIYQHAQARFLCMPMDLVQDGSTTYGYLYATIYDSQQYCFYVYRYDTPVTDADKAALLGVVDSVRFDGEPDATPISDGSAAFVIPVVVGLLVCGAAMLIATSAKRKREKLMRQQSASQLSGDNPQNPGGTL